MAHVAAMRQLYQRLGFSEPAANAILTGQNIVSLEDIRELDESRCSNLCKNLRRPGGTIPNPAAQGANPPPGVQENIPNPGLAVSESAEFNLQLAVYFLRHQQRVSRPVPIGGVTLNAVRALRVTREAEEKHKNPTVLPKIDPKDWPKTIDGIQDYLRRYLGSTGIPLGYVTRQQEAVLPAALDTTVYNTVRDEMIARAPHFEADGQTHTQTYKEDRAKVWELLTEICGTRMDCWTYIECGQPNQDGRAGFLGLYNNYLGPNKVDNQAAKAEAKLLNTTYAGEKKRWNFDKYVQVHISQFTMLQSLEQYGYKGIDARTRVRFLMAGIKTKDLDPVTTRIMSSPELKLDFDSCVNLYRDYIQSQIGRRGVNPALNIARISTGDAGAEDVEDRYYTRAEYNKLTPDQKLALKRRREARGGGDASGNNKGKRGFKRKKIDVAKEVRKLAAVVAQLQQEQPDTDHDAKGQEKPTSNRGNPALTRQHPRGSQS